MAGEFRHPVEPPQQAAGGGQQGDKAGEGGKGEGKGNGRVEVSIGHSADEIIILVRDNGRGFPAQFEQGLGLEISHTLVTEDLHGKIKFNKLDIGTEISVRLPRTIEQDVE